MKLNQIQNFLLLGLCLTIMCISSCSIQDDHAGFHIYELTGENNFMLDLFTLDIQPESPYIDKLHNLNPHVFVATNLTESVWDTTNKKYLVKSTETGLIYECKLKKGIKIRVSPISN